MSIESYEQKKRSAKHYILAGAGLVLIGAGGSYGQHVKEKAVEDRLIQMEDQLAPNVKIIHENVTVSLFNDEIDINGLTIAPPSFDSLSTPVITLKKVELKGFESGITPEGDYSVELEGGEVIASALPPELAAEMSDVIEDGLVKFSAAFEQENDDGKYRVKFNADVDNMGEVKFKMSAPQGQDFVQWAMMGPMGLMGGAQELLVNSVELEIGDLKSLFRLMGEDGVSNINEQIEMIESMGSVASGTQGEAFVKAFKQAADKKEGELTFKFSGERPFTLSQAMVAMDDKEPKNIKIEAKFHE